MVKEPGGWKGWTKVVKHGVDNLCPYNNIKGRQVAGKFGKAVGIGPADEYQISSPKEAVFSVAVMAAGTGYNENELVVFVGV